MNKFIPVHEKIFLRSAVSPGSAAVVCQDECISFEELDRYTSNLAGQLQEAGAGPGSRVGICLHPSASLALSVIAVLKAGAAYIPLSPDFPEERLRYILKDAGANVVIAEPSFLENAASGTTRRFFPDWPKIKDPGEQRACRPVKVQADDLAYILYTSGSTGKPKGVMIEHGNLDYYAQWFCDRVIPESRVGLPLTSSFIFAAAVSQFYTTLLAGKTLHVLDPMMIRQPGRLIEWFGDHPQSGLYCVPTLWSEILHYLESAEGAASGPMAPSCVYLSGEAVSGDLMKRSFQCLPQLQLWNLYGPTEATANISACRLYPGEPAHIGKPLHGTRIYIVGDDLKPVEPGATGELLASGDGIARGYLNLPELTEAAFFKTKLNGGEPVRVYRSGDLVREDGSGRLVYVGRKDHQVKIRGFRIELPEIEHALLSVPGIRHAVVKVVEDRQHQKRLAAYLVYREAFFIPVDELRNILLRTLPDFMVPEVFVRMEHLPQFPNGKTDRKLLPQPGILRPELGYPALPPSNAAERAMVRVWEEVLGLEGIGTGDNFFDLGGNSLKANAIVLELHALTGISLPIKSVFDLPTAGKLASHPAIKEAGFHGEKPPGTILPTTGNPSGGEDQPGMPPVALSENQKALWFMHKAEPGLAAYNIFYSITFSGPLDEIVLARALRNITDRHPVLRTRFGSGAMQEVSDNLATGIHDPGMDIHVAGTAPFLAADAVAHAREMAMKPFDLEHEAPCRFILYRLPGGRHLLAIVVHHLVFDGSSFDLFLSELATQYDRETTSSPAEIVLPASSYAHFCREEQLYLEGIRYTSDRQYWKNLLEEAPSFFDLATDYKRPEIPSREGGQVRRMIGRTLKSKLKTLGDRYGASMFMTCLSAFSVLLYRHSGRNDFLVGTPVANRFMKSFTSLIGYFVNTMLFRVKIDPELVFLDFLEQVKEQTLESLARSGFPFSHLGEVMKTERVPGINPFFQVMFAYHEANWEFSTGAGMTGVAAEEFSGCSKFDLFTEIFDRGDDAEIVLTYASRLYHPQTISNLAGHFMEILDHIVSAPGTRISEVNLLSAAEFNLTVHQWNRTAFSHGTQGTIADLIDEQVRKNPDLPALVSRHEVISYGEMGRRTGIIADNLRRLGVKKGVPVGIHLENSPAMVLCIMAVFKVGAVYIPLDPYYPGERLRYVMDRTRIQFLVVDDTTMAAKQHFPEHSIAIHDLLAETPGKTPAVQPEKYDPADVAYIMFTSGSTGNPKGVMIRHDCLFNFLLWTKRELNLCTTDTMLSATSINFDISLIELFVPLISGARLVLEKRSELQAPEKVEAILVEMKVNTVQFVPSGLKALSDAGVIRRASTLARIISGGEKLSKTLQDQVLAESAGALLNLYGPTEATVYMAFWHCLRHSPLRMVPIGRPIANARIYILNDSLEPLPIGVAGELYIGGAVLAAGYFEDQEQTVARFLPDPFQEGAENRIYKTGDLARFLHDGSVEFLGRVDQQVKIRGFRIELGEIEANILRFPGIRNVVVVARERSEEDVMLTAYLVPESGTVIMEHDLRDFLRLHLPAYMIPGHFIIAPAIPTLPNSKIDFKSLMKLLPHTPKLPEFIHRQMNDTERTLTGLWKDLLEHEAFNPRDNFFEVGGHSLLLVRLKELIADKLKAEVTIVDLFRYPSISSLSAFLRNDKPDHPGTDIARRVEMRNRSIRQQISKRISPDKNQY